MNGPDHYQESERLLDAWQNSVNEIEAETDEALRQEFENGSALADQTLAAAQAHATLALAAAAAYPAIRDYWGDENSDARGWSGVTG